MNVVQTKQVLKNMPVDKSVLLRAKHGVGKSSVIRQACEEMGIQYFDVRLSQCEVGDIKGLPFKNEEKKITEFLKCYWWPRDMNSQGVLFFDELNRASKDTLQAVFEICLDRRLDGEPLPKGWRVVAAINADDDYDVVELDPALLDRWFIIDFDPSVQEWVDWARSAKLHPAVVDFVARNPNLLDPPVGSLEAGRVYPSRRSWAALSDCLNSMNIIEQNDVSMLTMIAKGWVGRETALPFEKFVTSEFSYLRAEDVLNDFDKYREKIVSACADIEVIAALANSVVSTYNDRSRVDEKHKKALYNFFLLLPKDVASNTWTQILSGKKSREVSKTWQQEPEFTEFLMSIYTQRSKPKAEALTA